MTTDSHTGPADLGEAEETFRDEILDRSVSERESGLLNCGDIYAETGNFWGTGSVQDLRFAKGLSDVDDLTPESLIGQITG